MPDINININVSSDGKATIAGQEDVIVKKKKAPKALAGGILQMSDAKDFRAPGKSSSTILDMLGV
jgi:hypothetical protein